MNIKHRQRMRVAFLLGAGASAEAGIPTMLRFTARFSRHLGALADGMALRRAYNRIKTVWNHLPDRSRAFDLEVLYQILFHINRPDSYPRFLSMAAGLPKRDRTSELLEYELVRYIQDTCGSVEPSHLDYLRPLLEFRLAFRVVDFFSLNYDLCIEALCQMNGVRVHDGFVGRGGRLAWSPTSLAASRTRADGVRLIKLHGSVGWYRGRMQLLDRLSAPRDVLTGGSLRAARPLVPERALLYPGLGKTITREPFIALFKLFRRVLRVSNLCVVAGYSFVDDHVVRAIGDALAANPNLRLLIVDPNRDSIAHRLVDLLPFAASRIGVASGRGRRTLGEALRGDWLLHQVQKLRPLPSRVGGKQRTVVPFRRSSELRPVGVLSEPLSGVVADAAEKTLYVAAPESGALYRVRVSGWRTWQLPVSIGRARGLCLDEKAQLLYIVENEYRAYRGEAVPAWLQGVQGYGRVWRLDLRTHALEPVSWAAHIAAQPTEQPPSGVLSWPSAVVKDSARQHLLVTEARQVSILNAANGSRVGKLRPPLGFNLSSLAWIGGRRLLLLDHGVAQEYGNGRLMTTDIGTVKVRTRATLRAFTWCARYDRMSGLAFVTRRIRDDAGEICRVSLKTGVHRAPLAVTSAPSEVVLLSARNTIVVSTKDGLQAGAIR